MKKRLCILLSGALLCGCLAVPAMAAKVDESLVDPWAAELVEKAVEEKLMPECLEGLSLKENITRAQFAAVCVKLYERMSGEKAVLPLKNPFHDTNDSDVLKAYELGIVSGLTGDTFGGNELVTREQAATMLTSTYKVQRVKSKGTYLLLLLVAQGTPESDPVPPDSSEGSGEGDSSGGAGSGETSAPAWTPSNDTAGLKTLYDRIYGKLDTSNALLFGDHTKISSWARESVYFMQSHGVVKGVGGHHFQPKENAQAQAALIMAVNMLEKMG